jgi:geranylgeranyl diphosphate synthase type I
VPGITISQIQEQIDKVLAEFIASKKAKLENLDDDLKLVSEFLSDFILSGGKRFRPVFASLGYIGAGGTLNIPVTKAFASLELVHVCALIHDDLMDGSDMRRNHPAIHKQFESYHLNSNFNGSANQFGAAAAILLGDLALSWSDELLHSSDLLDNQLSRALPVFFEMREELMAGQYLDVLEGVRAKSDRARSSKIARLKSGKYSVERPLQFGASIAGANEKLISDFSKFGLLLGEAFQLRDDLLGVFGETSITGKPSGDDIREGKRTILIALALERSSPDEKVTIEKSLGTEKLDGSQIAAVQEIISRCGAMAECEKIIVGLFNEALSHLSSSTCDSAARELLTEMATAATQREK